MTALKTARRVRMLVVVSLLASACGGKARDHYVPELGELMMFQQARHTKLWLAGQAGNWLLAKYEIDELGEGFEAIIKYHPTHAESPVAPKDAIPRMITVPVDELRDAVDKQDFSLFEERYDALTTACNNCHRATNVGFNRVKRPETNPFADQEFSPEEQYALRP